MNINNFTIKSQEVIQHAQILAQSMENPQIENEHIYKAIVEIDENVLPFVLKKLNVNISLVNQILEKDLESLPKVSGGEILFSKEAGKTLNEANVIARKMEDEYVSIEHLIVALFKSKSKISKIVARKLLKSLGSPLKECKYSACFQIFKNSSEHDAKNLIKEEA